MVLRFNVSFLPMSAIEAEATRLLGAYAQAQGRAVEPPVPVEEILSDHLDLRLDLDDLGVKFGAPDALGAISIRERQVWVHDSVVHRSIGWLVMGRWVS